MQQGRASPITELLTATAQGDASARSELWTLVYDELRCIARHQMAREAPNRTMQPTALVNEAYLRLVGENHQTWANRCHFFAAAAKIMRQIRIDDARRRKRAKRGGGRPSVSLDAPGAVADGAALFDDDLAELLSVDEALCRLDQANPRWAEVVVLRYHGGLTRQEIAEVLGVCPRTVDTLWYCARAWLYRELEEE